MAEKEWSEKLKIIFNKESHSNPQLGIALNLLFCIDNKIFSELDLDSRIKNVVEVTGIKSNILNALYEKHKDRVYEITETVGEKTLRIWKNKLNEKIKFIESTPYNEETWEMLDKMQSNLVQAFKQHEQIQKELSKEKEQSGQGDSELSLLDKGEI